MAVERYKIVDTDYPYFVSLAVRNHISVFTYSESCDILLNSLRFFQQRGLCVYAYVLMSTHIHAVLKSDTLPKDLQRFKAHTAKAVLKWLSKNIADVSADTFLYFDEATGSTHKFWESDNHPEMIQYGDMMRQKIEYIHQNPVRAGMVQEAEDWKYSSAADYLGGHGLLDIITDW